MEVAFSLQALVNRKVKYDACGEVTSVVEVDQRVVESKETPAKTEVATGASEEYVKPAEKVGRYMKVTSVSLFISSVFFYSI